jgi:hypothetical protein
MFNNLFHSPTVIIKSSCDGEVSDSKSPCPFSQAQSFSVVGQHASLAAVLALFQLCCPPAVVWKVSEIVVDSVYGRIWKWLWSHVGEKGYERVFPLVAYRNSSSAIVVVFRITGVVASSLHFLPRRVFWRLCASSGRTSSARPVAPARLDVSVAEVSTSHGSRVSAFALAEPSRVAAVRLSSKLKNCKFVVGVSGFVRSVLAAPARFYASGSNGASAEHLFGTALAPKQPVGTLLAAKVGSRIADCGEIPELLPGHVFDAGSDASRIARSHSFVPTKQVVVRAGAVHYNCFGSFHYVGCGGLTQHV